MGYMHPIIIDVQFGKCYIVFTLSQYENIGLYFHLKQVVSDPGIITPMSLGSERLNISLLSTTDSFRSRTRVKASQFRRFPLKSFVNCGYVSDIVVIYDVYNIHLFT